MAGVGVTIGLVPLIALAYACAPAPIGDYPDTENNPKLPDRRTTTSDGGGGTSNDQTDAASTQNTKATLTVTLKGSGTGSITSVPGGLTCTGPTCTGSFANGTTVTLTPSPIAGAVFAGWSGGCTGTAACAPVMKTDVAITAEFQTLDGTWKGLYTNTRDAFGCTFNNAGDLSTNLTTKDAAFSTTADFTGLELRSIPSCNVVSTTTGTAPSSNVTVTGNKITGTWTANVQGANGTLAFPFTATVEGTKMTGMWTCATCKGSFTLTKQ